MKKVWFSRSLAAGGALAALVALAGTTSAVVPGGITQQGRLLDSDGKPVTGELSFTFTVYDDPSQSNDDNMLWTEVQVITLDDGYFSTRLGDNGSNPFPADLFNGELRYLGVKVGSDDEMTPRQNLASVAYAHMANNVNGDITPSSVTVNNVTVINEDGMVPAARIAGFSSLLSTVSAEGSSDVLSSATASCGAGKFATGGGCEVLNSDGSMVVKVNEPNVSGGKPTGWNCACVVVEASFCVIAANAVCLQEN